MAAAATHVKAVATIKVTVGGFLSSLRPSRAIDNFKDLIGRSLYLELVSSQLDAILQAPSTVLVTNKHYFTEMFLEDIKLSAALRSSPSGATLFWDEDSNILYVRVSVQPYLPSQTPAGLVSYRKKDLEEKRGNGHGERKSTDRIYDYDTYDDLGDPDANPDKARPVLGGSKQFPYPRRCRTGRPMSTKYPDTETRKGSNYVPRDEAFSEVKQLQFSVTTLQQVLHAAVPAVQSTLINPNLEFPSFFVIDKLFEDGVKLPKAEDLGFLRSALPRLLQTLRDSPGDQVLLFDLPANVKKDKFGWMRDEEFARETLAGINPYAIELVREFPLKSKLDPAVYGPAESAITAEVLERQMGHVMTVAQAMKQKRLFMLDFHDLFLPYVHKIRALKNTTMYGSRTIFFLCDDGTLRLLAIELTRPASPTQPQWRRVFTSSTDTTESWLWRMAKAHVRAHDSGHHELVSHWLRTHCAVEPYIIAANRQLSEMHPIYQLLHPHFRLTIKDYPFANDGLLIWDAIKGWVKAYKFWNDVRTVGHADKKDASGSLALDSPESLSHALTTIIWVASAHHAAVNFGQYDFGGYFPNRSSIARTNMPVEEPMDAAAYAAFLDNPDQALRECFPSQVQATLVMAVLDLLSTHSPDEEYLGGPETAPWNDDGEVRAAYRKFNAGLKEIEGIIDGRNTDRKLKNRCGAGILPYELMKPFSQPGVTGKGIPNITSI
ncbi:hypothetical protein HU200_041380 [Digitaria exilis]|uniref:Lipoxygenase n=1 Tax=Digitaria exilis TaxID=1010633 RepID=A0A835EFQ8_9POAL|nr:hypothetical protein HU200_041380 [Digitaria exilis]